MRKYKLLFHILPLIFLVISCSNREKEFEELGYKYISELEEYKKQYGVYPNSLTDIGIESFEDGPLYYEKKNDSLYIIWYGLELGESKIYYSDSKQWENKYRGL